MKMFIKIFSLDSTGKIALCKWGACWIECRQATSCQSDFNFVSKNQSAHEYWLYSVNAIIMKKNKCYTDAIETRNDKPENSKLFQKNNRPANNTTPIFFQFFFKICKISSKRREKVRSTNEQWLQYTETEERHTRNKNGLWGFLI